MNPEQDRVDVTIRRRWFPRGNLALLWLIAALSAFAAEPTTEPLLRLETGMHTAKINGVATDAQGRWAVTAADDKTARIWELASGQQLMVLRPPQDSGEVGKLYAVAMSPDGSIVALAGWTDDANSIYLFDRAAGRLTRRISTLPNVVFHLAFSPDGRRLAASLGGGNGIRVFDTASGKEVGRDVEYGDISNSVHFRSDGRRLVTACFDGSVRLYEVEDEGLTLLERASPAAGERPFSARFSPDGRRIAVGFQDKTAVQVLSGSALEEDAPLSIEQVGDGSLSSVAWSSDGRFLFAGGKWSVEGRCSVRRWTVDDWSRHNDTPVAKNTVKHLAPLPDGGMVFAAGDPAWGILSGDAVVQRSVDGKIADFRNLLSQLRVSADGRQVRFGYAYGGKDPCVFDLAGGSLRPDDAGLPAARTDAPGVEIKQWEDMYKPTVNSKPLKLRRYERSRSVAIAPDERRFVLGTEWYLRLFDRDGSEVWNQAAPAVVWAVNISGDGRFVVAAYGDGTIRWHKVSDGVEVMAFFPHADREHWIAWTPQGFFNASPGAEDLIGYHLNRGRDQEGEFIGARQLWETFFQPGLIADRLSKNGDERIAEAVKQRGDIRQLLEAGKTPELELVSSAEAESDGTYSFEVKLKKAGKGEGRLVLRVDGQELQGRRQAPALTPGGVTKIPIELATGTRKISAEWVDGRGISSKPVEARVTVRTLSGQEAPALHVLGVGISNYRDHAFAEGVVFAADDARAVLASFQRAKKNLFSQVIVEPLTDDGATTGKIFEAVQRMKPAVRPQDVFVLYLAGHGATLDGEYYFIPWEARFTNQNALKEQSLGGEKLRNLLALVPATKMLVLLDTCSSGRFSLVPGRGLADKTAIDRLQRMSGRALIAATADEKMALEGEENHGVFTFTLLQALAGKADDSDKDGVLNIGELAIYIDKTLPEITKRKWGYEQFPVMETHGNIFPVAGLGDP